LGVGVAELLVEVDELIAVVVEVVVEETMLLELDLFTLAA